MLKSIVILVLAMSAFAGSLAADTQQQCSDVVPDVNLARNDPPKEFEGVTIRGNRATLKPGYRFVEMLDDKVGIESIARMRINDLTCSCSGPVIFNPGGKKGEDGRTWKTGKCAMKKIDELTAQCQATTCTGLCYMY